MKIAINYSFLHDTRHCNDLHNWAGSQSKSNPGVYFSVNSKFARIVPKQICKINVKSCRKRRRGITIIERWYSLGSRAFLKVGSLNQQMNNEQAVEW